MNKNNSESFDTVEPIPPFRVPLSEISRRISAIQQVMQAKGMDALVIVQRVDLFYFSGTSQNGYLYIPVQGNPTLFIRKYMPRAEAESPIEKKIKIGSVKELPGLIVDIYGKLPDVIGFEWDVMPVREFYYFQTLLAPKHCMDCSSLILGVRMIKSDWEIECMAQTAELSHKIFNYIQTQMRPGLTEMEFSGIYEAYARKMGHSAGLRVRDYQADICNWHILSGTSGGVVGLVDAPATGQGTSAAFPCSASYKKLMPKEPVMVDMGTVINGYHLDETRMFSIGAMPDTAQSACEAVIDIHNAVIEMAKPDVTMDELYQRAVDMADSRGYAEQFLGPSGNKVTFIGHGVGLELVEPPFIARGRKDRLQPGMTLALEPKMVFENQFSAGIESVFTVTETGARLLSRVPVDIFIC
ncbi:Xaa-Pro peptidase family protein [Desulfobacula sp.]|uniref:M24 family metallopeptidase n=1 Tax=Desulfobacula sp. TaxID=2593537 RepID=UPI00261933B5|nr:Xaa-Pro peptidase family protein [Desulfobacula sp.]